MQSRPITPMFVLLFSAFLIHSNLRAQSLVNIDTVTVGDPGNGAYTNQFGREIGSISYEFRMARTETTISQYATFLNSVASVTTESYLINLWNPAMQTNARVAGISRTGSGSAIDPYLYSVIGSATRPIAHVGWNGAVRFANWMNNGGTNGADTETGAYTLNGATNGLILRNPGATWWLPSWDEWIKAGYYKGGSTNAGYWTYATQSDVAPTPTSDPTSATNSANYQDVAPPENKLTEVGAFTASSSAYGTFDQNGNVWELTDTLLPNAGVPSVPTALYFGGSWLNDADLLDVGTYVFGNQFVESDVVGFRIATVPEPSTYALLLMTGAGALWWARRRR